MVLTRAIRVLSQVGSDNKTGNHGASISHHQNDLGDGKSEVGSSAAISYFSFQPRQIGHW